MKKRYMTKKYKRHSVRVARKNLKRKKKRQKIIKIERRSGRGK